MSTSASAFAPLACVMVGVLSIGDLVKYLISAQAESIDNLEQYLTGAILD